MFEVSGSQHSGPKANAWASQALGFQKQSQNEIVNINLVFIYCPPHGCTTNRLGKPSNTCLAHADQALSRNFQTSKLAVFHHTVSMLTSCNHAYGVSQGGPSEGFGGSSGTKFRLNNCSARRVSKTLQRATLGDSFFMILCEHARGMLKYT